jgi:hypothetical protein
MKAQIKKLSKMLRGVTRGAKKGIRNASRRVKKFFSRGGARNATGAKTRSRRYRKAKGPLRRISNAVRRVGKGFRNTLKRVFSKKTKQRRRNKKARLQKGSSENAPAPALSNGLGLTNGMSANSPGIPPAPPVAQISPNAAAALGMPNANAKAPNANAKAPNANTKAPNANASSA